MDEREQEKISNFFLVLNANLDLLKKELEELKLQKKALMQKLLTGQVRVKV
jgi:type I restriction enzyme S subunit